MQLLSLYGSTVSKWTHLDNHKVYWASFVQLNPVPASIGVQYRSNVKFQEVELVQMDPSELTYMDKRHLSLQKLLKCSACAILRNCF